jgi:molecular chaperone GrpE
VTKTKSKGRPHQQETTDEPAAQAAPDLTHTKPLGPVESSVAIEAVVPAAEAPTAAPEVPTAAPEAEDPLQALQKEVEGTRALADEYLDGWQRSRADFLNYKKRVERDLEAAYQQAAATILTRYLPILDDIQRALRERPCAPGTEAWTEGLELIQRKLQTILETEGVESIPCQGQMFDPAIHEAITFEKCDGFNEGQVIDVVRQGYRLGDRILRPAQVRVAR